MTEIRINAGKAERIITQMLRDEQGVHPADAVALAARICRRLATAMPTTRHWVAAGSFQKSLQMPTISRLRLQKSSIGKSELWNASELWELVYNQGRHLRMS